jgi:flagellar biosynthetic protein FlhB
MKGRIRSLQRQMRRRMLRADVKKASVVITNPTHYAVALSFDMTTMEAPKVLAKGRDLVAAQIREEARWAGVPLVENPPLARSLYRAVEPGQSIPAELYAAVAAILAYLFRQEAEERMRREHEQRHRTAAQTTGSTYSGPRISSAGAGFGSAANKETR